VTARDEDRTADDHDQLDRDAAAARFPAHPRRLGIAAPSFSLSI